MGSRRDISLHLPGNFHASLLFKDEKEQELVEAAVHRIVHRAISLDGTSEACPNIAYPC